MAFIKLTKSQNIIDNINKIQQGDLLYIRVNKRSNPVWRKCFIYGTALAIEINKTLKSYCVYFLAESTVYMACFYSTLSPKPNRKFPNIKSHTVMKLAWISSYHDYFNKDPSKPTPRFPHNWKGLGL